MTCHYVVQEVLQSGENLIWGPRLLKSLPAALMAFVHSSGVLLVKTVESRYIVQSLSLS